MPDYYLGNGDPTIAPDPGAGRWSSVRRSPRTVALKVAFYGYLPHCWVLVGDDATKHMYHYFGNHGRDYTIDLQDMIDEVPSAKRQYEIELARAKAFVETLPEGTHQIASRTATSRAYNAQNENKNWYFAVGGYSAWGEGTATVARDAAGRRSYTLDFEYKFYDRYNWDGGKSVTIFGVTVTDEFMGDFHRQGLAREFNMYGSVRHPVAWGAPTAAPGAGNTGGRGRR